MDSEILFWLFLAVVYILQALASKRKRPQNPVPENAPQSQESMPSELEQALGEIGRVLRGEEQPPSLPEPHYEVPEPSPEPVRQRMEPSPVRRSSMIEKRRTKPPEMLAESVSPSAVFYDQAFENLKGDTFNAPVITHDHESSFKEPGAKPDDYRVVTRPNLADHMVSRQAFIAAEVLAPPLSKRKGRR